MHLRAGLGVHFEGSGCKKPKEKCTFKPALRCSLWVQGAKTLRKNAPSSLNPLQKITYISHRIGGELREKVALGAGKGIQEAIAGRRG